MTALLYPVSFLFVLSLVVIVHEFGHFQAARSCGVKVDEFSVGFGKTLWSRTDKKGTLWKVCLIPLGGYVKMLGDADAAGTKVDEKVKELTDEEKKSSIVYQPLWKKAVIAFAGPAMNYVFAIVLLTGLLRAYGLLTVPPVVSAVSAGSAAEAAGVLPNDRFISINGMKINEFHDIRRAIELDSTLNMVVLRDGKEVELTAVLKRENGGAVLGVQAVMQREHYKDLNLREAFETALKDTWELTADTTAVLKRILLRERSADDLRGPLGIAEASGDAAKGGAVSFLTFLIQVSIGIGFLNLLPVPMLDGGHLLFYAIEAVIRRPVPEKAETIALNIGFFLLIGLLIVTSWNDIVRIVSRLFG
ncbi:MAG TPA: RIP metalloprotease RseP [Alphaproteobacteria bacterium]|nr:RIP metalloprotease RseP [Alphaproteobacteria bacterium]